MAFRALLRRGTPKTRPLWTASTSSVNYVAVGWHRSTGCIVMERRVEDGTGQGQRIQSWVLVLRVEIWSDYTHCCSCCCHRSEHAPSSNAYLQPPDLTERMGSRPGAWQQSLHAVSKGEGGRQVERVLTLYLGHPDYPVLRPLFGTSRLETSTHPTLPSFLIPSPGHEPSLHAAHAASASSLLPLPTWLGRINLGNKEKTLQV